MKKKMRIVGFILICSTLLSSFGLIPASATEIISLEQAQVISFVEDFLEARARNEWLYETNDLADYLLPEPSNETLTKPTYSVALQTFLDTIDFYRTHRMFVGKERVDFQTKYDFRSVTVNKDNALVHVSEVVSYFITNGNGCPTAVREEYELLLVRDGGDWKVKDINRCYDYFYVEHKYTNFDKQEALETAKKFVLGLGEEASCYVDGETLLHADEQLVQSKSTSAATTIISYNPGYAAAYANIYTSTVSNNTEPSYNTTYYNPLFTSFATYGDCANFVSQCIWAGFGGDNSRANTTQFPKDVTGNSLFHWHCQKNPESHSDMWSAAYKIGSYAEYMGNAAQTENGWYGSVYIADDGEHLPNGINFLGSAFLVRGSNNSNYQHAIIITSASDNDPHNIYYCAHTRDSLNLCFADNATYMQYPIKIVKPIAYRRYNASCSGHVYTNQSSGNGYDSVCNNCGESRMLFTLGWNYGTVNTNKVISAVERDYKSCYKLILEIQDANGNYLPSASWVGVNSSSVVGTYSFSTAGLYTVKLSVWDCYAAYQESSTIPTNTYTFAVRIY